MYVSRAVRSVRDDPIPEAEVTLLVEVADGAAVEAVRTALDGLDGVAVTGELAFDTLRVRVAQERVDAVCGVDGLAAVETDATLTIDADGAGEDVEF